MPPDAPSHGARTPQRCALHQFRSDCPSRVLLDQIADKWSMMVLTVLDDGPLRFNAIRRQLEGVTQKALTQCLRRLERNGLVERRVIPVSPVGVEYEITPLGRTLQPPFKALYGWTMTHMPEVEPRERRSTRVRREFATRTLRRPRQRGAGGGSAYFAVFSGSTTMVQSFSGRRYLAASA